MKTTTPTPSFYHSHYTRSKRGKKQDRSQLGLDTSKSTKPTPSPKHGYNIANSRSPSPDSDRKLLHSPHSLSHDSLDTLDGYILELSDTDLLGFFDFLSDTPGSMDDTSNQPSDHQPSDPDILPLLCNESLHPRK